MQFYYLQSTDIQETLDAYASVKAQNEVLQAQITKHTLASIIFVWQDPSQPTIRALLGSSSDEDTIALSRASQADKMPIMGYKVETADLSDKVLHIAPPSSVSIIVFSLLCRQLIPTLAECRSVQGPGLRLRQPSFSPTTGTKWSATTHPSTTDHQRCFPAPDCHQRQCQSSADSHVPGL